VGLPLFLFCSGIVLLSAFRLALTLTYLPRFADTPNYLWLFPIGLRIDAMLMAYAVILPTALAIVLSFHTLQRFAAFLAFWSALVMSFIVYMEIATFPFVEEYDLRPDQKFWEYLKHTREVAGTLLGAYKLPLAIGALGVICCFSFFWIATKKLVRAHRPWRAGLRVLAFPFFTALIVFAARSSLGHRPINLSTAAFSDNHLANEFALNSAYSAIYSAYRLFRHEQNPSLSYGKMERSEILGRVEQNLDATVGKAVIGSASSEIPFSHVQDSPFNLPRPMNIVIFLQESMGAVDVGCLKGPPITPHLCALKDEGLWFSHLYATGTRTVRGIEAAVCGFLPTSAVGVVKLERAKKDFFTAGSLFKKYGYATEFIYGGMSTFDEMRGFFLGNGVEQIYDEPSFENPIFKGTWGVSDEDLVRKANDVFKAHGDKPFFALMLSTSNHSPYEFPDGRVELYEQPKSTHLNAIKYADYAIGLLFELAKKEAYYRNTLFLVVADHNSHVSGNELVPISKFHIPALIIGPNVPVMEIAKLASQIDLLPTLLHFSGLDAVHPMIGRDMIALPAETPGRAFMQYASNNAYRIGDDVVILTPDLPAQQFIYENETLRPAPLKPEMAKDALAFAHLPWILYSEHRYRLPN